VVFPDYSLSPEVRYPTAIEECYVVASWVAGRGIEHGLDAGRMTVAGDSTGGNMAIAVALLDGRPTPGHHPRLRHAERAIGYGSR
jgi:acetyl esterase/lipase